MAAREETVDNQEDESGKKKDKDYAVKIICLGDSAVGKSKWVDIAFPSAELLYLVQVLSCYVSGKLLKVYHFMLSCIPNNRRLFSYRLVERFLMDG